MSGLRTGSLTAPRARRLVVLLGLAALAALPPSGCTTSGSTSSQPGAGPQTQPPSSTSSSGPAGASTGASTGAPKRPKPPRRQVHRPLVAAASWSRPSEGYRLHVHPTLLGRNIAVAHPAQALDESIRLARPTPLQLTGSIRDSLKNQLKCHGAFARHKPVWNLEAWRPKLSYLSTVLHLCNP